MTLKISDVQDCELFTRIKELSGRLIERRRRRDRISQRHLAKAVGRSERWLREIEAGVATSNLEDHIRCAHSLQMATTHLFIPMLAMEHKMDVSREILMQDDLWDLEEEMLAIFSQYQNLVMARLAKRAGALDLGDQS